METAGSLRKEMKDIQQELRSGKISVNEAKEHANKQKGTQAKLF